MRRRRRGSAVRRVLIIVQNMPVPLDRRVWQECRALKAAGYAVSVICPRGEGQAPRQVLEGVEILTYRPPAATRGALSFFVEFAYCWLRTALLSLRVRWRGRIDVIQACNPPDTYFALALLHRPFGTRFVFDQHDLCPEVYASRFGRTDGWMYRGVLAMERATYRTAHHVVVTNESYRAVALRRGGLDPDSVTVVRSGPDPHRMVRGEARPELRNGRDHLCAWLGIMGPQDGVDLLLESIATLVHDHGRTDTQFALLGYGDCLEDLRAQATRLAIDPWVTFTGRADAAMVGDYLSTADIGLSADPLNPLNDVSTMNKTMEYMAYELPVVAYDLTETRVSAERAAVYVEPNDPVAYAKAVSDLLDSPAQRAEMGAIGRARIEDVLSWQRQVPGYVAVFDRLTGSGIPGAPRPSTLEVR
ncbi:MAG: glycosyltransferase family 4 protein [Acidimicrobiia bacterium]